jgi:hypothetical protein
MFSERYHSKRYFRGKYVILKVREKYGGEGCVGVEENNSNVR